MTVVVVQLRKPDMAVAVEHKLYTAVVVAQIQVPNMTVEAD